MAVNDIDILDKLVERIDECTVNFPYDGRELYTDGLNYWVRGFLQAVREIKDEIEKLKKEVTSGDNKEM
jgi:hypothetical protein